MQSNQPDDATGDSVTLARVHTFLAALLTFLGFGYIPDATVAGMLDELTGWLDMAKAVRRDPQGATARIWWEAFKTLWTDENMTAADCAKNADAAASEFGKRFLPVNDDGRDTFDTADLEALRTECDKLDANIALLESKTDDLQQNLDGVIAERDALLKANAHHASENEALRRRYEEAADAVCEAIGVSRNGGYDIIAICRDNARDARHYDVAKQDAAEWESKALAKATECGELQAAIEKLKKSNNEYLSEMAQIANAIDAIREVVGRKDAPDAEVSAIVADIIAERDELKRQLASAIVPLPKPSTVSVGQAWQRKYFVIDLDHRFDPIGLTDNVRLPLDFQKMLSSDSWIYLGTEKA
jgi:regulator of replication initiation timing